jgi:hypothetical protein
VRRPYSILSFRANESARLLSMLQRAVSARQFHRHAWSSPKRRLAAHMRGRVSSAKTKRRTYEISSLDCCVDSSHRHSDGNAARRWRLLQRQKVLWH